MQKGKTAPKENIRIELKLRTNTKFATLIETFPSLFPSENIGLY